MASISQCPAQMIGPCGTSIGAPRSPGPSPLPEVNVGRRHHHLEKQLSPVVTMLATITTRRRQAGGCVIRPTWNNVIVRGPRKAGPGLIDINVVKFDYALV